MAADDFGRADENPLAGEWSTVAGLAAIALVSGAIKAATPSTDSGARFNSSSEMSSRVKISTVGDSDGGPALWAAGTANGYIVTAGNGVEIFLYLLAAGGFTELQHVTGTYSVGSLIRIRRSGGNVIISKDAVDILTQADSTYLTGNPGVFCFGTVELDEFTDDVPTAGIPVPPTRIGVKFARPGRGPPSKGKFKVERIDSFEQNFFVPSAPQITDEDDLTGTSRARPGRGPFSLGRFFVSSNDVFTSAAVAQSVTIDQGSYSWNGQSVALRADRRLSCAQGSYALSGQAVGLALGHKISCAQGAYTLTGQAVTLVGPALSATLSIGQGSYTYTGSNVTARYTMAITSGSYSLTGQTLGLKFGHKFQAAQGSYTYSGQACALRAVRSMSCTSGSYAMIGQAVGLNQHAPAPRLTAQAGNYSMSGQSVGLFSSRDASGGLGRPFCPGSWWALNYLPG